MGLVEVQKEELATLAASTQPRGCVRRVTRKVDPEDCVHDAYEKVLRALETRGPVGNVKGYFYTTLLRVVIDATRQRNPAGPDQDLTDTAEHGRTTQDDVSDIVVDRMIGIVALQALADLRWDTTSLAPVARCERCDGPCEHHDLAATVLCRVLDVGRCGDLVKALRHELEQAGIGRPHTRNQHLACCAALLASWFDASVFGRQLDKMLSSAIASCRSNGAIGQADRLDRWRRQLRQQD